ncbi:hypothetical protein MKZ38_002577 [Zalerion maritima]|uniref:Uncharacterized protein n=1 Tax=Zalerion maritima TaxID=339359 RepID=A0AAD5RNT7_9PEZI|nr:hypothetical protein MKZ38_002577 [Zalerion maritima]
MGIRPALPPGIASLGAILTESRKVLRSNVFPHAATGTAFQANAFKRSPVFSCHFNRQSLDLRQQCISSRTSRQSPPPSSRPPVYLDGKRHEVLIWEELQAGIDSSSGMRNTSPSKRAHSGQRPAHATTHFPIPASDRKMGRWVIQQREKERDGWMPQQSRSGGARAGVQTGRESADTPPPNGESVVVFMDPFLDAPSQFSSPACKPYNAGLAEALQSSVIGGCGCCSKRAALSVLQ